MNSLQRRDLLSDKQVNNGIAVVFCLTGLAFTFWLAINII